MGHNARVGECAGTAPSPGGGAGPPAARVDEISGGTADSEADAHSVGSTLQLNYS